MSHWKVIFLVILLPYSLSSQTYQPTAIEGAHWVMYDGGTSYFSTNHHILTIRGDTVVNGLDYKKLYLQNLANFGFLTPPYAVEDEFLWGAIRDDVQERKVYVIAWEPYTIFGSIAQYDYQCALDSEILLYDFASVEGDTMAPCLNQLDTGVGPWVVDSIDTWNVFGQDRKTYFVEDGFFVPNISEGIGSEEHGLLGTLQRITFISYGNVGYFLQDYCVGNWEDCQIISSTKSVLEESIFWQISPNPARDICLLNWSITNIGQQPKVVEVFDAFGQQIINRAIPADIQSLELSLQHLSAGTYWVILKDDNGQLLGRKPIIKLE